MVSHLPSLPRGPLVGSFQQHPLRCRASQSWFATTMTLLPKPNRDHSFIRNWRPITLANCDTKIFSRILAGRLAQVLPRLLHPDQAGFVRGRSAPDIALTVKSVLAHAAEYEVEGALV